MPRTKPPKRMIESEPPNEYITCGKCPFLAYSGFCGESEDEIERYPETLRTMDRSGNEFCTALKKRRVKWRLEMSKWGLVSSTKRIKS